MGLFWLVELSKTLQLKLGMASPNICAAWFRLPSVQKAVDAKIIH